MNAGFQISILQAALIGIYYFLTGGNMPVWLIGPQSYYAFGKPLVGGFVVGLILGKPLEGMLIGAMIQIIYIANIGAGGATAADPSMAGILGTALALASGATAEQAVVFAVPLALVGNLRYMFHMIINSPITHISEKYVKAANYRGLFLWNVIIPQFFAFLTCFSIVFFGCLYGPDVVRGIIDSLPAWGIAGLTAIGGVLPAIGICINLNNIGKANTIPFFFIGFLLVKYLGFSNILIAIVGALIAYITVVGVDKPKLGGVAQ